MTDVPLQPLSGEERAAIAEAGVAVYADRLMGARPLVDDTTLTAVAEHCAGPLPVPLVDLWRTTFGGHLYYDLSADFGGEDIALSLRELFCPGSDGYQDLWGWIEHEREPACADQVSYLPIGGFEYLERVYVATVPGPGHGAVVCWRQGLPAGWELTEGDRVARIATDLPALFAQLVLESDPWETDGHDGTELRSAVEELSGSGNRHARTAAVKLRRLVQATVLDWRGALRAGTLAGQRRLRHLALDRAAAGADLALMQELVAQGCDPAERIRGGLTPIDVALANRGLELVRWLLGRQVPVDNTLRVGSGSRRRRREPTPSAGGTARRCCRGWPTDSTPPMIRDVGAAGRRMKRYGPVHQRAVRSAVQSRAIASRSRALAAGRARTFGPG